MEFFRRLFGGGGGSTGASSAPRPARGVAGDEGLYYFVRPTGCDEVVKIRVNPNNDLSQLDEGDGYRVRKLVRGEQCRTMVELEILYDARRQYQSHTVQPGELVTEADYEAWQVRA